MRYLPPMTMTAPKFMTMRFANLLFKQSTSFSMLIPFPTFESNLTPLIDSAHELHAGHMGAAAETLSEVHVRLKRFRRSLRHRQLAEFVEHALIACERGEEEYALAALMSAFAHFIPEHAAA